MNARIKSVSKDLPGLKIDALIVTDLTNVGYLTGFTGSSGYVIILQEKAWFLTDPRYTVQAGEEVGGRGRGIRVKIFKKNVLQVIADIIKKAGIKRVGFESRVVTYDAYARLKKEFSGSGVSLKPLGGVVEGKRVIKDRGEIDSIRRAIKVAECGYAAIEKKGVVGRTEKEVAQVIESAVKKAGAGGMSFDTIVASGVRSALPHASPTEKKMKAGDFVIVDMGVELGGYMSDETRTYAIEKVTKKQKKIYEVVREAHDRAIEMIAPGVKARHVDRAARDVIRKAGYGEYFVHGTGHGVGMNVHEAPSLGPKSEDVLCTGMVVTVEPGIYMPGVGGVRLEDMILVTETGFEVLSAGKKALPVLT